MNRVTNLDEWIFNSELFLGTSGLEYELDESEAGYVVSKGTVDPNIENIYIPDTYNGLPITQFKRFSTLMSGAFSDLYNLKSIRIPNSVTHIAANAFRNCTSLNHINLPNKLEILGSYTFVDSGLKSIFLPKSINTFGVRVFGYCEQLEDVIFENNIAITDLTSFLFLGCINLTTITIPKNITSMAHNTFRGCVNLEQVIFEPGINLATLTGFIDCYRLRNIEIPNSVTTIGTECFRNAGIELVGEFLNIILPPTLQVIGNRAFMNCKIQNITIPNNLTSFGLSVFVNASYLSSVIMGPENPPFFPFTFSSDRPFSNNHHNLEIFVPQGGLSTYLASNWGVYYGDLLRTCGAYWTNINLNWYDTEYGHIVGNKIGTFRYSRNNVSWHGPFSNEPWDQNTKFEPNTNLYIRDITATNGFVFDSLTYNNITYTPSGGVYTIPIAEKSDVVNINYKSEGFNSSFATPLAITTRTNAMYRWGFAVSYNLDIDVAQCSAGTMIARIDNPNLRPPQNININTSWYSESNVVVTIHTSGNITANRASRGSGTVGGKWGDYYDFTTVLNISGNYLVHIF